MIAVLLIFVSLIILKVLMIVIIYSDYLLLPSLSASLFVPP